MKAFLLGILLAIPFYLVKRESNLKDKNGIDSVKLKMNAPNRENKIKTPTQKILAQEPMFINRENSSQDQLDSDRNGRSIPSEVEGDDEAQDFSSLEEGTASPLETEDHSQMTELESGWNQKLKELLVQVDPAEGENLHKAYLQEQEKYESLIEGLMNDKQSKVSEEEEEEINQLISDLEQKHQEKLRDILGPHYDMVHEGYENFLENFWPQETI